MELSNGVSLDYINIGEKKIISFSCKFKFTREFNCEKSLEEYLNNHKSFIDDILFVSQCNKPCFSIQDHDKIERFKTLIGKN